MEAEYEDDEEFAPPPPPPPMGGEVGEDEMMSQQQQLQFDAYHHGEGFEEGEDGYYFTTDGPREIPPPWERHYSVDDEAFYYYNPETGECIWENEGCEDEGDDDVELNDEEEEQLMQEYHDYLRMKEATNERYEAQLQQQQQQGVGGSWDQHHQSTEHYQDGDGQQADDHHHAMMMQHQYQYDGSGGMGGEEEGWEEEGDLGANEAGYGYGESYKNEHEHQQQHPIEDDEVSLHDLATLDWNAHRHQQQHQQLYNTLDTNADDQQSISHRSTVTTNTSASMMSVVDRSNNMLQAKQQKIQELQRQKEAKEMESLRAQPELSKKSKQMARRSVEDMLQWEKERKARLMAKAQQLEELENAQYTGKPVVSKKADQLAYKRLQQEMMMIEAENGEGGDGDGGQSVVTSGNMTSASMRSSVEDRLYAYESQRQMKLQQLRQQQDMEAKMNAKPRIAPHSQRLVRRQPGMPGSPESAANNTVATDASDRLYALAQLRHSNPNPQFLSGGKLLQHDEQTGQRLFEPKINKTSAKIANRQRAMLLRNRDGSKMPVEDYLYLQGLHYQKKIEAKGRRIQEQEAMLSEMPKINPTSEKIVREKYLYYGESTKDRLHRPIGSVKPKTLDNMDLPTFKPKISDGSLEILAQAGNRFRYYPEGANAEAGASSGAPISNIDEWFRVYGESDGQAICVDGSEVSLLNGNKNFGGASSASSGGRGASSIYQRTTYWEDQRKKKLEQERQEREREYMKQCSFKPKVDSLANVKVPPPKGPLADRQVQWMKEREERLAIERQKREQDEVKDCTFTPRVLGSSGSAKLSTSITSSAPPPQAPAPKGIISNTSSKGSGKNVRFEESGSGDDNDGGEGYRGSQQSSSGTTLYAYRDEDEEEQLPADYKPMKIKIPIRTPVAQQQPSMSIRVPANGAAQQSQPQQQSQQPQYSQYQPPSSQQPQYAYSTTTSTAAPVMPQIRLRPSQPFSAPGNSSITQQSQQQPQLQSQYNQPSVQYQQRAQQALRRPTDLQDPDDDEMHTNNRAPSQSQWMPPQNYGSNFNDLEQRAHRSLSSDNYDDESEFGNDSYQSGYGSSSIGQGQQFSQPASNGRPQYGNYYQQGSRPSVPYQSQGQSNYRGQPQQARYQPQQAWGAIPAQQDPYHYSKQMPPPMTHYYTEFNNYDVDDDTLSMSQAAEL